MSVAALCEKKNKPINFLAWCLKHFLARVTIQSRGKLIMLHQSIKLLFFNGTPYTHIEFIL